MLASQVNPSLGETDDQTVALSAREAVNRARIVVMVGVVGELSLVDDLAFPMSLPPRPEGRRVDSAKLSIRVR
jgi:hypothetical protein